MSLDTAEVVASVIEDMEGKNVFEYVFKRSNQAVTLDCKCSVKVHGDIIQIVPQLLFQRLLWLQNPETLGVFRFELHSFCQHSLVEYSFFARPISLC